MERCVLNFAGMPLDYAGYISARGNVEFFICGASVRARFITTPVTKGPDLSTKKVVARASQNLNNGNHTKAKCGSPKSQDEAYTLQIP